MGPRSYGVMVQDNAESSDGVVVVAWYGLRKMAVEWPLPQGVRLIDKTRHPTSDKVN